MRTYPSRGAHGELVHSLGIRIVSGDMRAKEILNVDQIGLDNGVSRTVVREALKVLAGKGLVESVRKLGTFVTGEGSWNWLDPDVITWKFENSENFDLLQDLAEVRLILEPEATRLASLKRTEEDITDMGDSILAMALAARSESPDANKFTEADVEFHAAIYRATKNLFLLSFSEVMLAGLKIRDQLVHSSAQVREDAISKHRRVFESIVAKDPENAESRMRELIVDAAADVSRAVGKDRRRSSKQKP